MFRAEVNESLAQLLIWHSEGVMFAVLGLKPGAEELAAQINAGADVEKQKQEAVRMEREAVVNWLRQGLGCLENAIANSIERGDHTKGGAE